MKSLNSVKRKIGAFLAASLIATLLPTAGVLAADEENLIVNGDFSDVTALTEDKTYTYGDVTATIASGTSLPNGWEITVGSGLDSANKVYVTAGGVLGIDGKGYTLNQTVKNIKQGTKYTLSFQHRTKGSGVLTLTWLSENGGVLSEQPYLLANKGNNILSNYACNFVSPTDAAALKVSLGINSSGDTQDHAYDNIKLTTGGSEYINDGGFENVYTNGNPMTWSGADLNNSKGTTEKPASGSYSLKISASNKSVYQDISVIPGNWYKLSYKYAQENRQDGANLAPNISVAYQNAPSGADVVEKSTVQAASADGSWNDGVVYFYAPAVEGKAAMTVRVTLAAHTESGFAGAVYFDDVSVTQTTAGDASNADMNLLKNSTFKARYVLTSDVTYTADNGTVVTHKANEQYYPKNWTVDYNPSDTYATTSNIVAPDRDWINFSGTAFSVYQDVTGLEPGQLYSFGWREKDGSITGTSSRRTVGTVEFMHYDKANDTIVPLADWVSENNGAIINGRLLGDNANRDLTKVSKTFFYKDKDANINFVIPPYANAVRVRLQASGISGNGYCQITNATLKKTDEYITDGSMEISNPDNTSYNIASWYTNLVPTGDAPASATNTAVCVKYDTGLQPSQRILAETGKMYKISFKYAYDSANEGDNVNPNVVIAPFNNELGRNLFTGCTVKATQAVGNWTEYTGYFYIPKLNHYADGIVNLTVTLNQANKTSGNFYYDDVSIKQVEDTKLGFTYSAKGLYDVQDFVADGASNAAVIYVQDTDYKSNTFYAAKYDAETNELLDVQLAEIGSDMKAGDSGFKAFNFGMLEGESQNVYYKVFLWNSNMVPTMSNVRYN